MCNTEGEEYNSLSYYKQLKIRHQIKEESLKERSRRIMPEGFRFSKFIRHDLKERFLDKEEKIAERLKAVKFSKIEFKDKAGVILVDIITPTGEIINDIIRKDNINYNYCVNLLATALGVEFDE